MKIFVKKLSDEAVLPVHGSEDAAGWDLDDTVRGVGGFGSTGII